MAKWRTRDTVILGLGLGVLGWIIYRNWFRKGNVGVEDAGAVEPVNSYATYTAPTPAAPAIKIDDPYASGGASAAYDLSKMSVPIYTTMPVK